MLEISPFLRKLLALTLLVAVLFLAWTEGVGTVIDRLQIYETGMERDSELLARYNSHADTRPKLEAQLKKLHALESSQGGFMRSESPALAAASMQDRVKRVVTKSGGTLTSVQVLPVEDDNGYKKIAVNVVVAADVQALRDVLFDLETGMPYLFVEDIDLRRSTVATRFRVRGSRAPEGPTVDQLQVRLKIAGFMRAGES